MTSAALTGPSALHSERRPMTIMFCDLVGSTALATRLDPEDLRDVLTAYQRHATAIVQAAGGVVARYQGDGILVYFGHPAAREDDAESAIGAGLELARGLAPNDGFPEKLRMRVGIASGVLLVGELLRSTAADNHPVVGEAANLAAKLQELAGPDEVVICDQTQRLAGGLFDYRNLGLVHAKGLPTPLQAWQVVGRSKAASRFQALRTPTPALLGRSADLEMLLHHWASARDGNGRAVILSGEAGIGKSRLVYELMARIRHDHARVLQYDCSPQHQNSILYPFLERLRRTILPVRGDTAATIERLNEFFPDADVQATAAIGMLTELLALRAAASRHEKKGDAKQRLSLLFQSIVGKLLGIAEHQPVLIIVEDAHWLDPTSRELLDLCVEHIRDHPVLFVVTGRPGYDPHWKNAPHSAAITLKPISSRDAELLVTQLPGAEKLAQSTVKEIATRADGIPLYVEELTKAVVERALAGEAEDTTSRTAVPAIPSSLHASLTARLDRLGNVREVASIAAAVGRDVSFDLLLAVAPGYTAKGLREALQVLAHAGVLSASEPSSDTYEFRHALIQDAAYALLPRDRRRALHHRIAAVLEERFPDAVALQPELVAGHFTKASVPDRAIRYWTDAGNRSIRGSALIDAAKHLSEAISLVAALPAEANRDRAELKLQLLLGPVIMATKGYASAEALQVFSRARDLAGPSAPPTQQLDVLAGLFNVHYGRAEIEEAQAVARQHLAIALKAGREEPRAHCFMGQAYQVQGDFSSARTHFERTVEIFDRTPEDRRALGVYGSQYVVATSFLAGVYWALGEPQKAAQSTARSVEYANESEHVISIALALITRLLTPIPGGLEGDPAEAEEAVQFCARHGLSNFEIWARFAKGASMARRGALREGIDTMLSAVDAAENIGSRLFRPVQFATVASAYARLGDTGKALALVDEALAVACRTGERRIDSALHRLRGELLIGRNNRRAGKAELLRAIEIARSQNAVSEIERAEKAFAKLIGTAPPQASGIRRRLAALRTLIGA